MSNEGRLSGSSIDPWKLTIIGLDTDDGPAHPLYDSRAKLGVPEGLVRRMVSKGWTHGAIDVRRNGERLEVVAGRQRVKAAREANRRREAEGLEPVHVRLFVKRTDDVGALECLIGENELRYDDPLFAKAEKARRLMELGRNEVSAAEAFGVDVQTINLWLRVFDLDAAVQDAIKAGRVKFHAALELVKLPREEQLAALEALEAEGGGDAPTAKQLKAAVARKRGTSTDVERPGIRKIRRLLEAHGEEPFLSDDFARALRWVLGELDDRAIAGVVAATRDAG